MNQLTVNFSASELPSRDLVLKEKINLAEASALGLRETEPAPEVAEQVSTGVEQGSLASPIPSCRQCQHILRVRPYFDDLEAM